MVIDDEARLNQLIVWLETGRATNDQAIVLRKELDKLTKERLVILK